MPKTVSPRNRRWLPVVGACSLLIGAAAWVSTFLPSSEPSSGPREVTTTTTTTAVAYPQTLAVWEGKVARFTGDAALPSEVYDVDIATLPPEEQERLQRGIVVDSEAALVALLENYTA